MSKANELQALLATPGLASLGPGPRAGVMPEQELVRELRSRGQAAALSGEQEDLVRALVLLWHDHLDAAHSLAQNIEGADGAFVHGIMHRREPDYGNAAYWFRRVGKHAAFPEIARRIAVLLEAKGERELLAELEPEGKWDALAFVQACERAARNDASEKQKHLLQEIQRAESESLLDWFCSPLRAKF